MPAITDIAVPKTGAAQSHSVKANPQVTEYIANAAGFARPILSYLRELVHQALPDVTEEIKWSRPFFLVDGTIVCQMAAFKAHCGFGFWSPEMTAMLQADGVDGSDGSGAVGKVRSLEDLPPRAHLSRYLAHAADRARNGDAASPMKTRTRTSAKAPVPMLPEFAAALKQSKTADAAFQALSPSCRREYLAWIATAKRPETRERRVADAVRRIAEGRRFNDEYRARS